MKKPNTPETGQALIEGALALALLTPALILGGAKLWRTARFYQCERKLILEARALTYQHDPQLQAKGPPLKVRRSCGSQVLTARWPSLSEWTP